ncbi:MAG: hypothetical protein LBJ67_02595 [Planctomycetaceae bacterium]|jgi:hypothetical protein|nr:hypothetical protein [Planctomycetaceae bacterium]
MPRYFKIALSVFTLFFIIVATTNMVYSDDKIITPTTFRLEASNAWSKLKSEYQKGVDITIEYSSLILENTDAKMRVCFDKDFEMNHIFYSNGEFNNVINKKYAFNIRKKTDTPSWIVRNMFSDPMISRENSQYFNKILGGTAIVFVGILVEDAWFEELLNSNTFTLLSITNKKIDNEEYVELQFKSNFFADQINKVLGGKILLDPNHFWVIKEYEVEVEVPPFNKGEKNRLVVANNAIDYQYIDNMPFPQKYNTVYKYHNGEVISHLVFNFTSVKRSKVPQEIFYLKYYGFSEPVNPLKIRSTVLRIILIAIGVILILIGLYMKFLANKMKAD